MFSPNLDGSFAYTPNAGLTGTDMFTYRANDGTADSTVTMHGDEYDLIFGAGFESEQQSVVY